MAYYYLQDDDRKKREAREAIERLVQQTKSGSGDGGDIPARFGAR